MEPLRSPAERGRLSQVGSLRRNSGGGVPGRVSRDAWKVPALAHPPTRFAASTVRKLSDLEEPRGGGLARPSSPLRGSDNRASTFRCLTLTGRPFRGAARPRSGSRPESTHPHRDPSRSVRTRSVHAQGQLDVSDRVRSGPYRSRRDTGGSRGHRGQENVNLFHGNEIGLSTGILGTRACRSRPQTARGTRSALRGSGRWAHSAPDWRRVPRFPIDRGRRR